MIQTAKDPDGLIHSYKQRARSLYFHKGHMTYLRTKSLTSLRLFPTAPRLWLSDDIRGLLRGARRSNILGSPKIIGVFKFSMLCPVSIYPAELRYLQLVPARAGAFSSVRISLISFHGAHPI